MTQHTVQELGAQDCMLLLKSRNVGRVVFVDAHGPGAVPVNYGVANDEVVVRVAQHSSLRKLVEQPVAFQVDQTDGEDGNSWSVLVRGSGREVPLEEVAGLLKLMHEHLPRPWAEGVHNHWLAIKIHTLTGRRLGAEFHAALY